MTTTNMGAVTGSGNPEAYDHCAAFDAECESYATELRNMTNEQLQAVVNRTDDNRHPQNWQVALAKSVLAERQGCGVVKSSDSPFHHPV